MAHVEDRGMKIVRHNEEIQVNLTQYVGCQNVVASGERGGILLEEAWLLCGNDNRAKQAVPTTSVAVHGRAPWVRISSQFLVKSSLFSGFAVDMSPTADGHLAVPPGQGSLPRNVSLATFVRGKLDTNAVCVFLPCTSQTQHALGELESTIQQTFRRG